MKSTYFFSHHDIYRRKIRSLCSIAKGTRAERDTQKILTQLEYRQCISVPLSTAELRDVKS